jgi:hypothetical protein
MLKDEGGMLNYGVGSDCLQHSAFILQPFPTLAPAGR